MAAPHPLSLGRPRLDEPRWERVVREDDVGAEVEARRLPPRERAQLLERVLTEALLAALERVV